MSKTIAIAILCILSTNTLALRFSGNPTDVEVDGDRVFFKVNGGMPHVNTSCTSKFRYEFIGDKNMGLSVLLAAQISGKTLEYNLVENKCYANYSGISAVKVK
ncbi:hypothetical protein [Zooshikella ganghwensis]|uniref:Uncharacterized protein n=1 Tax=Zooshikella ganghwensis TaxID=202772 RepID=A0A4P9VQ35_9GAMM|nr:hypothetical protein [Zooshikella ganghwensis]RDH45625.1 hypothetical protein B9G39_20415 [Zooshikella ganghwensis]